MTVEINGYELNCANILYVTPIADWWSPLDVAIENASMIWQRFDIIFKGRENDFWFTSNYGTRMMGHNFETKEELESARRRIITTMNQS